jgi:hypothetical protein
MGLDMHANFCKSEHVGDAEVDFVIPEEFEEELCYWRKHPNLHGWMEELYRSKGGTADYFNGVCVRLNTDDLLNLKAGILSDSLPETQGFFFGQSSSEYKERDLEFIEKAIVTDKAGFVVYYDSSW